MQYVLLYYCINTQFELSWWWITKSKVDFLSLHQIRLQTDLTLTKGWIKRNVYLSVRLCVSSRWSRRSLSHWTTRMSCFRGRPRSSAMSCETCCSFPWTTSRSEIRHLHLLTFSQLRIKFRFQFIAFFLPHFIKCYKGILVFISKKCIQATEKRCICPIWCVCSIETFCTVIFFS